MAIRRTAPSPLLLPGRTVLITGAASGIGAASARALAAAGAHVALVDLQEGPLRRLADELGPTALPIVADVTDQAALADAVASTVAEFGAIDVCFANAGVAAVRPTTIAGSSVAEFERIIEVDLLGVWRTVRACLPEITRNDGHVLLTASVYAFFNGAVNAPYAMSKAGVESFGRALRSELAGTGATAGVLYPGWVATPIIEPARVPGSPAEQLVRLANPGPLGTPISPERVAEAVVGGIQRRRARIIVPRRWIPFSMARGVFNALTDAVVDRHRTMQTLIREVDADEITTGSASATRRRR